MSRLLAVILAACAFLFPAARVDRVAAEDRVDLLLVLAADISRSVDAEKFRIQREGYAAALTSPRVMKAIQSAEHGRIAITFVEWSGASAQTVVADWTIVSNEQQASAFAERVRNAPRAFMERTAIGAAIDFAMLQLARCPYTAPRRVIDVSGDGTSNSGRSVVEARDAALAQGVTINGLAILSDEPLAFNPAHTHPPGGLLKYYEDNVIGGPGAFAIAAKGHEEFGTLILSKLVKEIALGPVEGGIDVTRMP